MTASPAMADIPTGPDLAETPDLPKVPAPQTAPEAAGGAPSAPKADTDYFRLDEAIEGLRSSSQQLRAKAEAAQHTRSNREAAVWNIAVDVQVVLGTLDLTVADLLAMKPETAYPLGSAGEKPLELVAGGRTIGWCELVAPEKAGDPLSIRITKMNASELTPATESL